MTLFQSIQKWILAPQEGWALAAYIIGALGLGALILGAMTAVPPRLRKPIVIFVTFVGGLFLAFEFLLPAQYNSLTAWTPKVANSHAVIGSFALLLGIINLFQLHGKAVTHRREGWINSAAFFVAFFGIMIAGFLQGRVAGAGHVYNILFDGFLKPLQSTTFSLIAFYIVSAAYRAFRIKSTESILLMTTAAIIMLALVPVGASLTAWIPDNSILAPLKLENMGYWLLIWPNMAVQRALAFGVGIGAMATGLRIWLSLERGSFFDRQL